MRHNERVALVLPGLASKADLIFLAALRAVYDNSRVMVLEGETRVKAVLLQAPAYAAVIYDGTNAKFVEKTLALPLFNDTGTTKVLMLSGDHVFGEVQQENFLNDDILLLPSTSDQAVLDYRVRKIFGPPDEIAVTDRLPITVPGLRHLLRQKIAARDNARM